MKNAKTYIDIAVLLLLTIVGGAINSLAQGTAFTYQGRLNDGVNPANGIYDLRFTVYNTVSNGNVVAGPLTSSATGISGGMFTVTLDFGVGVFTGPDRWLEIAARTNGGGSFATLTPRQLMSPTPYAIMANSASNLLGPLPAADLSGTYGNALNLNNGANNFDGTFSGQFLGSSFIGGNFTGNFLGTGTGLVDVWHVGGNFGTTPANFLGTTDNQNLVLKVNNQHAQRYESTAETPNVIGGWAGNSVQPGLDGASIGGGGSATPFDYGQGPKPQPNVMTNNGHYATIAGGYNNIVGGYGGAILGGSVHRELGDFGVIGGGQFNTIASNSSYAVIGGGYNNSIQSNTYISVIAGGHDSQIVSANYSFIGGGGLHNILNGAYDSFIGAGGYNYIGTNAHSSFVGGGGANVILDNASYATIPGGQYNSIGSNAYYAVISGGQGNTNHGPWSVTTGGYYNTNNGLVSFIGAGDYNATGTNDAYSFLGGGFYNVINGYASVLGGGGANNVFASFSVIGGGNANTIQSNAGYSFIGGGYANVIQTNGAGNTIVGGSYNAIGTNSFSASIGGGSENTIGISCSNPTIAGGSYNSVLDFSSYAAIGGGVFNTNNGYATTVPGGSGNFANGSYSFAAGRRAKALHSGSFVWADSTDADFASSNTNQFNIRANGGVRIETSGGTAYLNGQQILSGIVPGSALSGTYPNAVTFNNIGNSFSGDGSGLTALNASALSSGTVPAGRLTGTYNINISGNAGSATTATTAGTALSLNGRATNNFWTTTGNSGISPGANFIGTSDGASLLIKGGFVGVNRTGQVTLNEYFGVDAAVSGASYGGMYINTTSSTGLPFYGYAQAGSSKAYHYLDGGDGNKWKLFNNGVAITVTTAGQVGIGNQSPTNLLMVSNARCDGSTWINASDRNLKENFAAVNTREILEKVVSMPITKWNYKTAADTHLGPVAQDFHEQFKLGSDDKSIATVDESGVALAAIQGLNQKLEQEVKEKDARIGKLEKRLAAIEAAMQRK